jgi:poly [ADP-ribose] polymerase
MSNFEIKDFYYLVSCRPMENNYKFWKAIKKENMFECYYGRIGSSGKLEQKSESGWRTKYNGSISDKKGYIDRTEFFELISLKESSDGNSQSFQIENKLIHDLIVYLNNASSNTIKENYILGDVLPNDKLFKRVNELISNIRQNISVNCDINKINNDYLELISLSQRKLRDVKTSLFTPIVDKDELQKAFEKIDNEQELLDALEQNVKSQRDTIKQEIEKIKNEKGISDKFDILKSLGINIEPITKDEEDKIKKIIKDSDTSHQRFKQAFRITNYKQQEIFDNYVKNAKNKETQLLWHGSKSCNYLSIISKSLLIRPSFANFNGNMWDSGIYAASDHDKSFGYTDSGRWVGGQSTSKQLLLLFDFHVGKQLIKTKHDSDCYNISKQIKNSDYDSVWAQKGVSLYRSEYIIYDDRQCTPKYIVEFE